MMSVFRLLLALGAWKDLMSLARRALTVEDVALLSSHLQQSHSKSRGLRVAGCCLSNFFQAGSKTIRESFLA